MLDQNTIMITGTVIKDVVVKYGNSGKAFTNINIANNYNWNKADNKNEAQYYKLSAFDDKAEKYAELLKKGSKVAIMGRLRCRKYQNEAGLWFTELEIYDYNLVLHGTRDIDKAYDKSLKAKQEGKLSYTPDEVEQPNIEFDDDDEFPF
jgi:single-strand DNA-binding protein